MGGNCRTSILVTVSPMPNDVAETRSSLQFGARAAAVQNRALRGVRFDPAVAAERALVSRQLLALQEELAASREESRLVSEEMVSVKDELRTKEEEARTVEQVPWRGA